MLEKWLPAPRDIPLSFSPALSIWEKKFVTGEFRMIPFLRFTGGATDVPRERSSIPIRDVDNNRGGRGIVIRHPPVSRGRDARQEPGQ